MTNWLAFDARERIPYQENYLDNDNLKLSRLQKMISEICHPPPGSKDYVRQKKPVDIYRRFHQPRNITT